SFSGENQGSRNSTSKTININDAPPYIDNVSYKDINSDIQDLFKNDKKILRNNSELRVVTGKAEAGKYATLKKYIVELGGRQYQKNASGNTQSSINIDIGKINQSNTQTATITVEDSRGSIFRRNFAVD